MSSEYTNILIFIAVSFAGVFIEGIFGGLHTKLSKLRGKKHNFTMSRYVNFLIFPILASLLIIFIEGMTFVYISLVFAVFGTVMEWLLGFMYHRIVGQRLWTYHRFALNGYTSYLSVPLWGIAGIFFLILARVIPS